MNIIPDMVSGLVDVQVSRLQSDLHSLLINCFRFTDGIQIQGSGWDLPSRKELCHGRMKNLHH